MIDGYFLNFNLGSMKFVKDYKYNQIPYCTQCNKHSEFTATTTNQIRGGVTIDNPEGFNPTFFANNQMTKLICKTCGQEMDYLKDFESDWQNAHDYSRQFFTDSEVKEASGGWGTIAFTLIFIWGIVALIGYLPFNFCLDKVQSIPAGDGKGWWPGLTILSGGWGIFLAIIMVFGTVHILAGIIKANEELEERAKRASTNGRLNICTSPNNEKVVFNQKTGEITYE